MYKSTEFIKKGKYKKYLFKKLSSFIVYGKCLILKQNLLKEKGRNQFIEIFVNMNVNTLLLNKQQQKKHSQILNKNFV